MIIYICIQMEESISITYLKLRLSLIYPANHNIRIRQTPIQSESQRNIAMRSHLHLECYRIVFHIPQ